MAPPAFEDLQTFKLKVEGTSISVESPTGKSLNF